MKDLARVLETRIEMRQIGVRDEAKLLADYGDCGKPVCCNTHLTQMPPVSMKMAKIQKTTLDPAKISGRCGRLKCCLRYEYDTYRALEKTCRRSGRRWSPPRARAGWSPRRSWLRSWSWSSRIIGESSSATTMFARQPPNELSRRAGPGHRERPPVFDRGLRVHPRGAQPGAQLKLKGRRERTELERPSRRQDAAFLIGRSGKPRSRATSTPPSSAMPCENWPFASMDCSAATVLAHWGVRSTSDIGDIVYNLIAAGDLEKTAADSRSDFDNVFDFETALKPGVAVRRTSRP